MSVQARRQIRISGNNLAIIGEPDQDWFIGWSPEENFMATEGTWEEWVLLAQAILDENDRRRT